MREWRRFTPEEQHDISRFENICKEHSEKSSSQQQAVNAIAIAARHFSTGSSVSLGYRRRLLEIAAEVTGVQLVRLPQPDGTEAMAWPPVRGEVGWPPYEESPEAWAAAKE